jgi:hypothetical protein
MGRHNKLLPIGHTWKGIKAAIRRKSRGVFKIKEFTYSLPKRFFGEVDSKGNPWIPVVAYGLDLRYVLAKALLASIQSCLLLDGNNRRTGIILNVLM